MNAAAVTFSPSAFGDGGEPLRWNAPGLAIGVGMSPPLADPPTVEAMQAIEEAAKADGYAHGHAEGLAAGQDEIRRMVQQVKDVLDGFARPLARLDAEVSDALADLAVRVAGVLVGREYAADPTLLADLVREALDTVGSGSREMELRLHPDDFGLLAPHLAGLAGVRLTPDASLRQGELRLQSEGVRIDGTLASRLQSVLEATLANADGRA